MTTPPLLGGKPTQEELDKLEKLMRTRQYSAKQLASIMNRTKGSIMGLIWRTPILKKIGLPNVPLAVSIQARREGKPVPVRPVPVIQAGPRTLMEMQAIHCKFPLWAHNDRPDSQNMLFCCETRMPDSPYCDKHYKLCCTPTNRQITKTKQLA